MGITKLMYINRDADAGGHSHLKNALEYIMNPLKTENGRYIGGANCLYSTPDLVHQCFMQTKDYYGKTDGRQAYHYILSLDKGEGNPEIMQSIMKDFCSEYLGDAYEYVYCVHTDKEHMHGHVIFNSVSCKDGLKYHYKQGDWQKYIQPITNRLCEGFGLSTIQLTKEFDFKAGDWKSAMREDMDLCRDKASSYTEFLKNLQAIGYTVHDSPRHKYLTLIPPGKHADGFKGHRTDKLGEAYKKSSLLSYFDARLKTDRIAPGKEPDLSEDAPAIYEKWAAITYTRYRFYIPDPKMRRLYVDYRKNRQLIRSSYDKRAHLYKQDVNKLNRLMEKQAYLSEHGLATFEDVRDKHKEIRHLLAKENKAYKGIASILKNNAELCSLYESYQELHALHALSPSSESEAALNDIKSKLDAQPYTKESLDMLVGLKKTLSDTEETLKHLRKEKRILEGILKDSERLSESHTKKEVNTNGHDQPNR